LLQRALAKEILVADLSNDDRKGLKVGNRTGKHYIGICWIFLRETTGSLPLIHFHFTLGDPLHDTLARFSKESW
jgi:hypothetical protein